MASITKDNLLTTEDCCRLLGVTRATLQRYIKIGRFSQPLDLPYQRKYWRRDVIDNFFGSVLVATAPETPENFEDYAKKIMQDKLAQLNIDK